MDHSVILNFSNSVLWFRMRHWTVFLQNRLNFLSGLPDKAIIINQGSRECILSSVLFIYFKDPNVIPAGSYPVQPGAAVYMAQIGRNMQVPHPGTSQQAYPGTAPSAYDADRKQTVQLPDNDYQMKTEIQ